MARHRSSRRIGTFELWAGSVLPVAGVADIVVGLVAHAPACLIVGLVAVVVFFGWLLLVQR